MVDTNHRIMLWNCRGSTSKAFIRLCNQYPKEKHSDILVIMETRVDPNNLVASEVRGYLGRLEFVL